MNNKLLSKSLAIMVPLSNRNFAFIVNVESFPRTYLVELSPRKRIKKKNVNFYKPDVIFRPPKMNFIFTSSLTISTDPILASCHIYVILYS